MLFGFGKNTSGRVHATLERNNNLTRWKLQDEEDEYNEGSETDNLEELHNEHDESYKYTDPRSLFRYVNLRPQSYTVHLFQQTFVLNSRVVHLEDI